MTARRAATRLAVALAVAIALVPTAPAAATEGPYVHVWRIEDEGGAAGARTLQLVDRDLGAIARVPGGFAGTFLYADRIVVTQESGGRFAQSCEMTLTLEGVPAGGGSDVSGSFEGTATLTEYAPGTVSAARGADWSGSAPSSAVVYRLTGAWEAAVRDGRATGTLRFRASAPVDTVVPQGFKPVSWFNRLGEQDPGAPQRFSCAVAGAPTDRPAGRTAAGDAAGPIEYVRLGIAGRAPGRSVSVPAAQAALAKRLRDAAPAGATRLPADAIAIDLDVAGGVLDAKNRADGAAARPAADAAELSETWRLARVVFSGDARDGGAETVRELASLLGGQRGVGGAAALAREIDEAVESSAAPLDPRGVLHRFWTARAVEGGAWEASVLGATARVAEAVRGSSIVAGTPAADAVLAAADSPDAPSDAVAVESFARDPASDASPTAGPDAVMRMLAVAPRTRRGTTVVAWEGAGGPSVAAARVWLGYRRADGTAFCLAGEHGAVALTDSTLAGWAFRVPAVAVVDAGRVGRVLAAYPVSAVPGDGSYGE